MLCQRILTCNCTGTWGIAKRIQDTKASAYFSNFKIKTGVLLVCLVYPNHNDGVRKVEIVYRKASRITTGRYILYSYFMPVCIVNTITPR